MLVLTYLKPTTRAQTLQKLMLLSLPLRLQVVRPPSIHEAAHQALPVSVSQQSAVDCEQPMHQLFIEPSQRRASRKWRQAIVPAGAPVHRRSLRALVHLMEMFSTRTPLQRRRAGMVLHLLWLRMVTHRCHLSPKALQARHARQLSLKQLIN